MATGSILYLVKFFKVIWGMLNPAIKMKPTAIGFRQLAVSTMFTLLFILFWLIG